MARAGLETFAERADIRKYAARTRGQVFQPLLFLLVAIAHEGVWHVHILRKQLVQTLLDAFGNYMVHSGAAANRTP